jgi:hypothetical protein
MMFGLSSQRLQRMRDAFQADIDKGIMPGVNAGCRKNGGRDRDRTCDPLHVKEVLFR